MPPSKTSGKFIFSRREPDLPAGPATGEGSTLFKPHDVSLSERTIEGATIEKHRGGTFRMEACLLNRVTLANSSFSSVVWKDVRLVDCDLANFETRALSLTRVEFINCRMTGFRAGEADCRDLLISGGDQRYLQFRFSRAIATQFESCNFSEADFYGTDLSGARIRKCDLRNAEMSKAKLTNTDLRGSLVEGLHLSAEDIRGAVVDPAQAMIFALLLGIRIE